VGYLLTNRNKKNKYLVEENTIELISKHLGKYIELYNWTV